MEAEDAAINGAGYNYESMKLSKYKRQQLFMSIIYEIIRGVGSYTVGGASAPQLAGQPPQHARQPPTL